MDAGIKIITAKELIKYIRLVMVRISFIPEYNFFLVMVFYDHTC